MNITYKLELDHKPKKDTTHNIYVRVTKDRKVIRFKTGVSIFEKDYNKGAAPGKWIRRSNPNYVKLNESLEKSIDYAKDFTTNVFEKTPEANIKRLKTKPTTEEKNSNSFIKYFEQRLKVIKEAKSYYYYKNMTSKLSNLKGYIEYLGIEDLNFSDLNVVFLDDYENYLKTKKKAAKNTIYTNIKMIRTIFYYAIREGLYMGANPFLIKKLSPNNTKKDKLSIEDIRKIEALELEKNSSLWHCRNFFMFQFYLAGTRIGDLMTLKWKNIKGDRIIYDISKTEENNSVLLVDKAQAILKQYKKVGQSKNEYILPILPNFEKEPSEETLKKLISSKTAIQNKNLKKLQALAGIEVNISTHIARHSYSNILLNGGASTEEIKTLLRHSSVVITERYLAGLKSETTDKVHSNILNTI
jgi:site-specific recombinase XerD